MGSEPHSFRSSVLDRLVLRVQRPSREHHGQSLHLEVKYTFCLLEAGFMADGEEVPSHVKVSLSPVSSCLWTQSVPDHRLPAVHTPSQRLCLLRRLSVPGPRFNHVGLRWKGNSVSGSVCIRCLGCGFWKSDITNCPCLFISSSIHLSVCLSNSPSIIPSI